MLYLMQVHPINAALGRKVADFRKAHGWSQAQLAERFGAELGHPIDPTAITRLEQGKRPVPVHELVALGHVLAVEPTVFFKFLSPLDDALATTHVRADGLRARAWMAQRDADAATWLRDSLASLQRYRETRDTQDLVDGLNFLYLPPELGRRDWRELLLDAEVPAISIDAALDAAPGFPGEDGDDEVRKAFVMALIGDLASPPKRRRKTGKAVSGGNS